MKHIVFLIAVFNIILTIVVSYFYPFEGYTLLDWLWNINFVISTIILLFGSLYLIPRGDTTK